MIVLVRHAYPAVDREVPPSTWHLSAEGRMAAEALCSRLVRETVALPCLVSSPEPKAVQTLAPLGAAQTMEEFREVHRPHSEEGRDWKSRRLAYLSGERHEGWEDPDEVVDRFETGLANARQLAAGRSLVIGTHGMAMTLWLSRTRGLDDPIAFWSGLTMPDAVRIDGDGPERL
ncbi:histidine phosphatase family protein [Salininema proteolyticum]|uniref:Histidine phosphatase family protein n=1 Tax=Salininema proteolyticum TaxID=1607685 RepID=A0ABV8U4I1_9ACTN